jgi:hypothetical protein
VGWWGLFVFLALGLLLEAFQGFKIRSYLDVSNETRRAMFRLAHAHGTLVSLLNVVFALWATSRLAPAPARLLRAGACLSAALVLLPGGFFLGGFFSRSGDPGLGVLLVPMGAAFLLTGVWFARPEKR